MRKGGKKPAHGAKPMPMKMMKERVSAAVAARL
jgi:hypothetical protein